MKSATRDGGFTLVEIMIVVAIIGLLATFAVPSFLRARVRSQTAVCINSLRQIDSAKEQWALMSMVSTGPVVVAQINDYMKKGAPVCPGGGTYSYNNIGVDPTCSVAVHHL